MSAPQKAIPQADRDKFVEITEIELLGLHNFARYQIHPLEFAVW